MCTTRLSTIWAMAHLLAPARVGGVAEASAGVALGVPGEHAPASSASPSLAPAAGGRTGPKGFPHPGGETGGGGGELQGESSTKWLWDVCAGRFGSICLSVSLLLSVYCCLSVCLSVRPAIYRSVPYGPGPGPWAQWPGLWAQIGVHMQNYAHTYIDIL